MRQLLDQLGQIVRREYASAANEPSDRLVAEEVLQPAPALVKPGGHVIHGKKVGHFPVCFAEVSASQIGHNSTQTQEHTCSVSDPHFGHLVSPASPSWPLLAGEKFEVRPLKKRFHIDMHLIRFAGMLAHGRPYEIAD